ncbi:hypothetical protein VE03_00909 [Pseudogymnoascus sp. 23342-1-I1]|nr:hypothetical protein VE03_00909 [Pseudogymnoascus sp. 23342-1-I1]
MRLSYVYLFWAWTLLILLQFADARSESRDAIKYIFPIENPVINTPSQQVNYRSHFDLTFSIHNKRQQLKLSLEPNDDIIAETAHIEYVDGLGNIKYSEPIDRPAHMVFKGSAWIQQADGSWAKAGWARIYLRRGGPNPLMEGAFSIMGDNHHVQLQSTYIQTKRDSDFRFTKKADEHMIIHRDSDTALHTSNPGFKRGSSVSLGCEADKLSFNSDPNHPILLLNLEKVTTSGSSKLLRHITTPGKRQSDDTGGNIGRVDLQSTIGNTNGCPTTRRVAMVGIATDCTYTASFGSVESVRQNIISMVNTASDVYERSFNITIGIQRLTISDAECPNTAPESAPWNMPCSTGTIARRLDLFSHWRASRSDDNAYWTLLSTCSSGNTVGIAWLGQLCVSGLFGSQSQSVTGANVVVRTPNEWQIFAYP